MDKQDILSSNKDLVYVACEHLLIIHLGPPPPPGLAPRSGPTSTGPLSVGSPAAHISFASVTRGLLLSSSAQVFLPLTLLFCSPSSRSSLQTQHLRVICQGLLLWHSLWVSSLLPRGFLQLESVKQLQKDSCIYDHTRKIREATCSTLLHCIFMYNPKSAHKTQWQISTSNKDHVCLPKSNSDRRWMSLLHGHDCLNVSTKEFHFRSNTAVW